MTRLERLEYYSRVQEGELRFRDGTLASLGFYVAVLTVLIGAAVSSFKSAPPLLATSSAHLFFYFWLALGAVALLAAVGFVSVLLWGFEYAFPAAPRAIEDWLAKEVVSLGDDDAAEATASATLCDSLISQTADAACINRLLNRRAATYGFWARAFTVLSVVFLSFAFVPFSLMGGLRASPPACAGVLR